MSRSSPLKSGSSRLTVAEPSRASGTGPENSATVFVGVTVRPSPPS